MENEYPKKLNGHFDFFGKEDVQKHFADLNIELLRGKHIQKEDFYLFQLLSDYHSELKKFYSSIYGLDLIRDKGNSEPYFYLSFQQEGKGKLYSYDRHKTLSPWNTIIGITMLNLYYEKYFEYPKEFSWKDIEGIILEGEHSNSYKKLLFDDVRGSYSDREWEQVLVKIRRGLRELKKLGWVKYENLSDLQAFKLTINESIHRLAKLYEFEINHFDKFVELYQTNLNET